MVTRRGGEGFLGVCVWEQLEDGEYRQAHALIHKK